MSIILRKLTKNFGDQMVVKSVSLEIEEGELFVLLGESGSGKSTILRMIAGLTAPDEGSIELNGKDVTDLPPQLRGTGFVFQNYSIFRHMTATENIEFGLRLRKVPQEQRRQRSEELLDLAGLAGLGSRYPDQLSGGQRQRVALARALAYQPAVLLLDEPFGALDVKIRSQLRRSLKEIQRQLKVTTILVTHDQEEAFELADRIGVITRGNLIEVGRPEDLYHRPATEFVATFVGGGNVLIGRLEGGKVRLGSVALPFPEQAPKHDEGSPVGVLFRPEAVTVDAEPFQRGADLHLVTQGRVVERVFAGSQERIRIEVDALQGVRPVSPPPAYGAPKTIIEAFQPSSGGESVLMPGERVWLGVHSYHVLAPTGLRLLICSREILSGESALRTGAGLAELAEGPVTVMTVVESEKDVAAAREKLELLNKDLFQKLPNAETKIRKGSGVEQILLEALEGNFEIVVIGSSGATTGLSSPRLGAIAQQLITRAGIPVLIVSDPRESFLRVLICTAAGEPGKSDVRFGGRVARQLRAQATVLHVRPRNAPGWAVTRAERHLNQARSSLEALEVRTEIKAVEREPLLEGILEEAESGDFDLIVVGAPLQPHRGQTHWTDLTSRIIERCRRPVLVVPMSE